MTKGIYIALEGLPGSGKTTKRKILMERFQAKYPGREILGTREPGGSEVAEAIRLLEQATTFTEDMEPICEQHLLAAARAQSLRQVVKPVLAQGGIVISDYSFFTSMAFQGFGRQLTPELVLKINETATENLWPDLAIVLDMPIEIALQRTSDKEGDKFEKLDKKFFERVKLGYEYLAKTYPARVKIVDGVGEVDQVTDRIWKLVAKLGVESL